MEISKNEHIEMIEKALAFCTEELEQYEWDVMEHGEKKSYMEHIEYYKTCIVALTKLKRDVINGDADSINMGGA